MENHSNSQRNILEKLWFMKNCDKRSMEEWKKQIWTCEFNLFISMLLRQSECKNYQGQRCGDISDKVGSVETNFFRSDWPCSFTYNSSVIWKNCSSVGPARISVISESYHNCNFYVLLNYKLKSSEKVLLDLVPTNVVLQFLKALLTASVIFCKCWTIVFIAIRTMNWSKNYSFTSGNWYSRDIEVTK